MKVNKSQKSFSIKDYWNSLFAHFGLKKCIIWAIESYMNVFLGWIPIIPGTLIRRFFYRFLIKSCGKDLFICQGAKLLHSYNLEAGDRCTLSYGCMLNARGGLKIGNDFTAGPEVIVWTVEHNFMDRDKLVLEQGEYDAPVVIGNDVWCGARAVILPGVKIADGTVVAAGAVVSKNTEPYSVVGGVPAKTIKYREPQKGIEE